MFCVKPKPVVIHLLITLSFISSTFVSPVDAVHQFHNLQALRFQGIINRNDYGVKRSVLEGKNVAQHGEINSSLVLAANRTHRKDPLDHFKYYKMGWNISEKHYFSSVGFTAAPLFLVAALWFLGFGLCLLVIGLRHCCSQRRHYGYSRTAYALCLICLTIFTIAAIVGCVLLYTGQRKFHSSTTDTLDFVVKQADNAVTNLTFVSENLLAAKSVKVDKIFQLPLSVRENIERVDERINASAAKLEEETKKNANDIQVLLDAVRIALIVIAAVMLILAFLGFLASVVGMQVPVYTLATFGWILVTGTFILCGLFLILHNVVTDTCVAMDQWVQNPTAHNTALDDILPCFDDATAQLALSESENSTSQLVQVVNNFITNVANYNQSGPANYNQSGPLVPALCNPFNSSKTDRQCAADEVNFTSAAKEWRKYICQVSSNDNCTTVGRLTPAFYDQMTSTVTVSFALYQYGPFLVQLGDCTFVRQTFSGIIEHHCPSLKRYSEWLFVGLVIVSASVMLSLIFWVLYARERRHRKHTKELIAATST